MRFQVGDRIQIIKPRHPARGQGGVLLAWGELDGSPIAYVATPAPHYDKPWPVYVLRPWHLELVARCEGEAGARFVEAIIDAVEARGCPIRIIMKPLKGETTYE